MARVLCQCVDLASAALSYTRNFAYHQRERSGKRLIARDTANEKKPEWAQRRLGDLIVFVATSLVEQFLPCL